MRNFSRAGTTLWTQNYSQLPQRLRAPIVLCYLEGLTDKAASSQLGVSEATVRGRLARARECPGRRLTARGVAVPTGLVAAGAAGQGLVAIPAALAHSTVRIALGFMAGTGASVLARRVLNAMILNQLRVAMVLLLFGIGGRYWARGAIAELIENNGQADPGKDIGATAPVLKSRTNLPAATHRFVGTVRVEGTGKPVAGAKVHIHAGDTINSPSLAERMVESDADGLFAVDLPPGPVYVDIAEIPAGHYWCRKAPGWVDSFFLGPDESEIRRDYRIREGTVWDFQLTRGKERKPTRGFVSGFDRSSREYFEAQADVSGQLHFTLPSEGRLAVLAVREASPSAPQLETGFLSLRLEWGSNFQPSELNEIVPLDHVRHGFRLIDANQRSATLVAQAPIEPVVDKGQLVIRVALPDRDSSDLAAVRGQVLDERGRPLQGVLVGLAATRDRVSSELRHQSTTNAEGMYRLRDIPRRKIGGQPMTFQIVVTKQGYAGFVSPPLGLKEATTGPFQVVDPVRLKPGVVITGVVVDHRGQPVAGAHVRSSKPIPYSGLSATIPTVSTDERGRFTMNHLRPGKTQLTAFGGLGTSVTEHLMVESAQSVLLQLPKK